MRAGLQLMDPENGQWHEITSLSQLEIGKGLITESGVRLRCFDQRPNFNHMLGSEIFASP